MLTELSNLKPSIYNALVILGIVIIGIPLIKYAMTALPVPGLKSLVDAV